MNVQFVVYIVASFFIIINATHLNVFVNLIGRLLRLIRSVLLLLDHLTPLLQLVVASRTRFLQSLLKCLDLGLKTL